ncbi:hypothetical protein ACIRF8_15375 [Streptomyces sp. NPDC102406]|uniref:hypothetical protein n=1 Tax=Streptomyces sp. NPDC102406 TaxID=3366171 RepID=UPI0037FA468C
MRPWKVLLLTVFLLLVGLVPAIAELIGDTVGLIFTGGLQLLSQPPVFALAAVLVVVAAYRNRPRPAATVRGAH